MITCEDCATLQRKGFFVCTSAERMAVLKHTRSCKACYEASTQRGLEAEAVLSPNMTPEEMRALAILAVETRVKDMADPENK